MRPSVKVTEIAKAFPATCRVPDVGVSIVKSFDDIREEMTGIAAKVFHIMKDHSNELELYYQEKRLDAEHELVKLRGQVRESEQVAAADPTVKSLLIDVEWYKQEVERVESESNSYKRDILEYKDCDSQWERDRPLLEERILNLKWQIHNMPTQIEKPLTAPSMAISSPTIDPDAKKRIEFIMELDSIDSEIERTQEDIACKSVPISPLVQSVIVKQCLHQVLPRMSREYQSRLNRWMGIWNENT